MRWVSTRVLPEPAPARISRGPSPWVTASRWGGLSPASSSSILASCAASGIADPRYRRGRSLPCRGVSSYAPGLPEPPNPPLVDVVLPTYGPVPYLGEALASALAQTYPAWRLTVVDNSPETGGAEGVLAPYMSDARVRYMATGGLGQAENWNAALAAGDAPYVAMLHDDDLWDPEFLDRRVAGLEEHRECAFAFSAYREIDEQGALVGVHAPRIRAGVLPPAHFVRREFARNVVAVISVMYRRSALDAVGDGPFRAE